MTEILETRGLRKQARRRPCIVPRFWYNVLMREE
jgi:hypothetical protein